MIFFCSTSFQTDFLQSQRYPRGSHHRHVFFNFKAQDPAAAKSSFVPKKRRTRAQDMKQFAKILKTMYPDGIKECVHYKKRFPNNIIDITSAIDGDDTPDYPAIEDQFLACMGELDVKIPSYPLK